MIELSPDRLSVFNYAHLPNLFAAQRKIKDEDLPLAEEKLEILQRDYHHTHHKWLSVYWDGSLC